MPRILPHMAEQFKITGTNKYTLHSYHADYLYIHATHAKYCMGCRDSRTAKCKKTPHSYSVHLIALSPIQVFMQVLNTMALATLNVFLTSTHSHIATR